jgi:hypothetical protein
LQLQAFTNLITYYQLGYMYAGFAVGLMPSFTFHCPTKDSVTSPERRQFKRLDRSWIESPPPQGSASACQAGEHGRRRFVSFWTSVEKHPPLRIKVRVFEVVA